MTDSTVEQSPPGAAAAEAPPAKPVANEDAAILVAVSAPPAQPPTAVPPIAQPVAPEPPAAQPPAAQPPAAQPPAAQPLAADVARLLDLTAKSHQRLDDLEERIACIPRQVQLLGNRIGGLATSVNEPRSKALLLDMLRLHDLIEQFTRSHAGTSDGSSDAAQGFQLLLREVRQILMLNGLVDIPADGAFNPELHRAMRRVPTDDAKKINQISTLLKPGFRTEQGTIVRYAEVEVWHHQPAPQRPAAPQKLEGNQP